MKKIVMTTLAILGLGTGLALAEGDLSRADIITVDVELGQNADGMYIKPSLTTFETGQAYKLHIFNTDDFKHELALNALGEASFTRKIQIEDEDGGLIAEIKGAIREVEVGPGATADWYLVPVQTVDEGEMTCELEGHLEAGMRVHITVE
jgi:uncharacterized cupredoxin-like copper-binding protein